MTPRLTSQRATHAAHEESPRVKELEQRVHDLETRVEELQALVLASMTGAFQVERVAAPTGVPGVVGEDVPEEHLLVISAVVAALGVSARVKSIHRITATPIMSAAWARRGRELHFASHVFGHGLRWRS